MHTRTHTHTTLAAGTRLLGNKDKHLATCKSQSLGAIALARFENVGVHL